MKTIETFLSKLNDLNIQLLVEDDKLRCRAPKGVLTAEIQADISEYKTDIIQFLQPEKAAVIPIAPKDKELPLSFAQQRLWFLTQLDGQSAAYNMHAPLRLAGQLNEPALQRALTTLIERHESLRLCFPVIGADPVARLIPVYNPLSVIDLTGLSETDKQRRVKELTTDHAQMPFDLNTGPLLSLRLLKLGNHEQILLFNMHHIISDAWSIGVLIREWSQLYNAYAQNQPAQLPKPTIQYTDYAAWQREWLQGEVLETQLAYWAGKLAEAPELLKLPTDYPRPVVMSYKGKRLKSSLDAKLTQDIKLLSRQHGATVFMTLLAAFNVLLSRYSGQTDMVLGSPIANRAQRQTRDVIGFFVNTLALRAQIKWEHTFIELLQQVKNTALEAYGNQDIPFEYLVEQSNPTRSMSHSPLFQVMFVLQNAPEEELELSGLKMSFMEPENTAAKFDLTLSIWEKDNAFICDWEYCADLYRPATINRMAEHFQVLLTGIINNPEQPISQLPLITETESLQLQALNQPETDYDKDNTIIDMFQTQVEKTPDNIAVVFPRTGSGQNLDKQLTYKQLNQKANQLAHYLLDLKTGADNRLLITDNRLIGICVERSLDTAIGLLGILKAGAAYVPLDPEYPDERLAFMIKNSGIQILITQSKLQTKFVSTANHEISIVNIETALNSQSSTENLQSTIVNPGSPAYVIYTSGSTGAPKGVMIEHAAIAGHINNSVIRYQIDTRDNVLQFASLNFDASIEQIFSAWTCGARLIMLKDNILDPKALLNIIHDEQITIANLPPAYWRELLRETDNQKLEKLKLLILGGEALSSQLAKQTRQTLSSDTTILNAYGPTEATITAALFEVTEQFHDNTTETVAPIGRPIAGGQIYILDTNHNPAPIGIPGELCIGGRGLARGYLNRPALTAEKFIEIELFGQLQRIYKTGDLARWLPDGNLEYLGRLDHQIKLRGFRIELGEIETALSRHEAVNEAVVELYNKGDNPRLAAYVTLAGDQLSVIGDQPSVISNQSSTDIDQTALITELRAWLKSCLPEYMLPASFTVLDKLPLTPNGKIDRKALPEPDFSIKAKQQAPRTETEHLLSNIWSHELRIEAGGRLSNFFEAGGHSLLAVKLVSRIRESFGIEMPLRTVFEKPVLAEQAEWLDKQQRGSKLPPIIPQTKGEPLVLSFAQQRLWFLAQLAGQSATYNMPAALRLQGRLNEPALQKALSSLIQRHESLRLCFPVVDGEPSPQIKDVYNPLSITDLRSLSETEQQCRVEEWIANHAQTPFDLSAGPLLSIRLLKLGEDEQILLFNMHHIISDGWSIGVMIREWTLLYSAYAKNQEPKLPKPTIKYSDYAAWQRGRLQGKVLADQLSYWADKLSGAPELLEMPTDYPRPAEQSYQGKSILISLDQELAQEIKRLSRQQGATVFMTLLAVFKVLLSRYSGQADIVVGSPIANRAQRQTEDLIGLFVNTLALRAQIKDAQTFSKLLKQVRKTALEAYGYQDIPFEYLVEQLNPARSLSHSPLFQVMFALQNAQEEDLEFSGLKVSTIEPEQTTAKFDLTLSVAERDNSFVCAWEYNTDLFRKDTIIRMTKHFQRLLEGIINNPEQSVFQLPMITEAEQKQLQAWNRTETDYDKDITIVDLFQAQVEKAPDNVAVVFPSTGTGQVSDQQLTYKQLNQKANQLAHYLLGLKTATDNRLIGICIKRSLDMAVGLLGILKTGAAYVPLDPEYPDERLAFMIKDSGIQILITQSELQTKFVSTVNNELSIVNIETTLNSQYSIENLQSTIVNPEDPAYVIYTSGSTGTPKGVIVEHAAIARHINHSVIRYQIDSSDSVLQFASLNFDASIEQIFSAWTGGARLIMLKDNILEPKALLNIIHDEQITIANLPPAYWRELLSEINSQSLKKLKLLILGGEALSSQLARQTRQTLSGNTTILNAYGPTEATITTALFEVTEQFNENKNETVTPIGRPIAGSQIYILDANHNPAPIGIPGELCIAGSGLARGYLNRPELTTEKFVEIELFGKIQRIYKTGDIARWLDDGNIEYIGRLDNQIKLRGFRIELGEIETALSRHEAVKEAVVELYNKGDNPCLVAYVTLTGDQLSVIGYQSSVNQSSTDIDQASLITELRAWLKACLPEYMLPAGFMILDKFPLTPNGKIDVKALPAPDFANQTEEHTQQTETEHLLSNLWSQTLGIEVTSVNTHFFEAGGHSLLATQLVSRIREGFDIEMPLRTVFEKPVLAEQAEWLDKQQRGLELPPIEPLAKGKPLALSFAQQRLWFLAQMEGESSTYNMPAALRLQGQLNEEALQHALTELIERHESLRLCFPVIDEEPGIQLNDVYNPLSVTDLTALSKTEQQCRVDELAADHAQTAFDLNTGPLLSLRLLKLNSEEHVLLFNMHHIISDGWSMGVMIREWSLLYNAYALCQKPQLPKPLIQYTDYATWQRDWLQSGVLEQQLSYWREKLNGAPDLLQLPTDYPRPAVMSYHGKHLQCALDQKLTQGIKQLGREHGATVFMTLLAAFNVLLSRYSRQTDIAVGSPIANRAQRQTEDLIGFFVNTLVLRAQINEKQSFPDLLKQVRKTALEAYSRQDIPFEYLVEQLNPSRSLSHAPLFQVMFALQNTPEEELELNGLKMSFLQPDNMTAKFDLTLNVAEQGGAFVCDWEYCSDLFRHDTIARMAKHFQILLEGIISNPEQPLSSLQLITENERRQLQSWNKTETNYDKGKTIVSLFQEQVEKTPDNIAVVFPSTGSGQDSDQQLTYKQLNQKANQLAHYLLNLKTSTDNRLLITGNSLIGICVERSLEMVIGLLGILKAGGAYVPLDNNYPGERLAYMIKDSGIRILITQSELQGKLLPIANDETSIVNIETALKSQSSIINPDSSIDNRQSSIVNPDDTAYVIYTSGSTGTPKGVCVPQQAVARLVHNAGYAGLDADQAFLQYASVSFDAATFEIWGALLNGAKLVVMPPHKSSLPQLSQCIQEQGVTILWLTSSLFNTMLDEQPEGLLNIKQLLVGGEELSAPHIRRAIKALPNTQLINGYGPTENTTFTCCYPIERKDYPVSIPIGSPINNTSVYILDKCLRPLPIGLAGELYTGGLGLAHGYLNRPELTAEKFVDIELFGKRQRIYKTGDLARWLPDGNIEYLGRLDHQVKLRGFRIELGEIETTLSQHKAVNETVVALHNSGNNPRLIAYVSLTAGIDQTALITELRAWLKARLPEHMLPAGFMVLDKMPLTPNGKIDRKAISKLSVKIDLPEGEFAAPGTQEEKSLTTIWSELLEVEQVGIHNNFFDLGGHSLLLIKMQTKVSKLFNRKISMIELFEHPTIHTLAKHLASKHIKQPTPNRADNRRNQQTSTREQREARQKSRSKFRNL